MANYFVRKTGSDGAAGTSAGTAWQTIGKALGATGISSGDTVYVGAGVYRESVTVAMTSAAAETKVVADVEGEFTGDAGEVRWTAYTTNDKTSPTTKTLILAGRDFLTFQRIVFVGGSSHCVDGSTTVAATNIKFQDCTFVSGTGAAAEDRLLTWTNNGAASGTQANWTVERCIFVGTHSRYIELTNLIPHTSDYDILFTVRNCLFVGGAYSAGTAVVLANGGGSVAGGSGGSSNKPGGLVIQNCTNLVGAIPFLYVDSTAGGYFSTSVKCRVKNNISVGGIYAGVSSTVDSDYNFLTAVTNYTNVTGGANDKTDNDYSLLLHFGQALQQKRTVRPFGMPTIDSPFLAFDNASSNPSALSTDFLSRPKPSGGGVTWTSANKAIGYLEHHDFAVKEASVVDSGNSYKVSGPGDLDIRVPVDATSTTITVKVYRDSNYGGGTAPRLANISTRRDGYPGTDFEDLSNRLHILNAHLCDKQAETTVR
jgi:hypothetical protein